LASDGQVTPAGERYARSALIGYASFDVCLPE